MKILIEDLHKSYQFLLGINWQMFSIADCRLEYVRSDYSLSREKQKVFWENLASKELIYRDFDKNKFNINKLFKFQYDVFTGV